MAADPDPVGAASPHPRGWTPEGLNITRLGTGLPRTRGDGPSLSALFHDAIEASPHPRGWTYQQAVQDGNLEGFPAPAGMDLVTDHAAEIRDGFPAPAGMDLLERERV